MGYNTVLLILNDAMDAIDKDPRGWWAKALDIIGRMAGHPTNRINVRTPTGEYAYKPGVFGHGNHGNGFEVVSNQHADQVVLMTVGGNMATILGSYYAGTSGPGSQHHTVEGQAEVISRWALENGYQLANANEIVCLCGDIFPTIEAMAGHIFMVHTEDVAHADES